MTGEPYTTNFALNVLDLRHIDLATEEDKKHKVDYWARLFVAKTWEEFRAVAAEDPALEEVGKLMYNINADEMERNLCEAHRKYVMEYNTQYSSGKRAGIEEAETYYKPILEEKDLQIEDQGKQIEDRDREIEGMRKEIEKLKAELAAR